MPDTLTHAQALAYLQRIDDLVSTDFVFSMDCNLMPHSRSFTQQEATEMADLLGRVYQYSHRISCEFCRHPSKD